MNSRALRRRKSSVPSCQGLKRSDLHTIFLPDNLNFSNRTYYRKLVRPHLIHLLPSFRLLEAAGRWRQPAFFVFLVALGARKGVGVGVEERSEVRRTLSPGQDFFWHLECIKNNPQS